MHTVVEIDQLYDRADVTLPCVNVMELHVDLLCLPPQLDCCGKGDDTALFKQVAGTLCPRKTPEDFLKSQVPTSSYETSTVNS